MKIQIEWRDTDIWRSAIVELKSSQRGNLWFEHNGSVYVFRENKQDVPVFCKAVNDANAHWLKAGRITKYHQVFLGEGLSFSEHCEQDAPQKWEKPVFA